MQFANPGARPFFLDVEDDATCKLFAHDDGEGLALETEEPRLQAVVPLLIRLVAEGKYWLEDAELPAWGLAVCEPEPGDLAFWNAALGWDGSELPFCRWTEAAQPFPKRVIDNWLYSLTNGHKEWKEASDRYATWRGRFKACRESLEFFPLLWPLDPFRLAAAEAELTTPARSRRDFLFELHQLGVFQPEDGDVHEQLLLAAGCPGLARWRRAALWMRWVLPLLDGAQPADADSPLEAVFGPEWFVDGPMQQAKLDPLSHMRFSLNHMLDMSPPVEDGDTAQYDSRGFQAEFRFRIGVGLLPQLVASTSPEAEPGDRIGEVAARQIRDGRPLLGGLLAAAYLAADPAHRLSWIEVAAAAAEAGRLAVGRAALDEAARHGFRNTGHADFAALRDAAPAPLPAPDMLVTWFAGWGDELDGLDPAGWTQVAGLMDLYALQELKALWPAMLSRAPHPALARQIRAGLGA